MVTSVRGLFIILSAEDAEKVRGQSAPFFELQPAPLDDGRFCLGTEVLEDDAHEKHIPYLATLPWAKLIKTEDGSLSVRWNSERPSDSSVLYRTYVPHDKANPLDNPRMPTLGDWSKAALYESVGRALTKWEAFEAHLAALFTMFIGPAATTLPALRAYGSVIAFDGRLTMVRSAAEAFFSLIHDKRKHRAAVLSRFFDEIAKRAVVLSRHRNRIAHGAVQPYTRPDGTTRGVALQPAMYATRGRSLPVYPSSNPPPEYAYTSGTINFFAEYFWDLQMWASRLWGLLNRALH